MYELTESQTLEIGGGLEGIPYHYKSQRLIPPPVETERPFEPVRYPGPPMPFPPFSG